MIAIIGGGVSGLTCGVVLQEAGYEVTVWSRDELPQTTSSVAAAIWHPFQVFPEDKVTIWSAATYDILADLAHDPTTGVVMQAGRELFHHPAEDPPWRDTVRLFRRLRGDEITSPVVDGYVFETPVAETPVYLRYLRNRFERAGGRFVLRTFDSVDEALGEAEVVINCSGLGSYELVGDTTMYPIRGQIVLLAPRPDTGFCLDDHGPHLPAYIIPRADGIVCGGTVQRGNWDTAVDQDTAERILQDVTKLMPELADQPILAHKVGLRPGRPEVRLEAEQRPGGVVIHNYGHGGSGYTLSWGCAADVLALVRPLVG